MPNSNSTTTTNDNSSGYATPIPSDSQGKDSYSGPDPTPAPMAAEDPGSPTSNTGNQPPNIYSEVARRISEAKNVLIALSSDPSVDEMAAAIGLSIYLDRLGKRATAIYSGTTPNALEFLKPEQTFESTADTLQDFVVAISKDKADHLRYKLDGSYVKIYITPYRSRIGEDDLDFSYGDYNVDLVLALDISNGIDLDSALREHGRIMHDAVIINITTNNPGKFGEIEWSDKKASSVSEMIARLLYSANSEVEIGKEEATAFLTGIVAATNRFSNANTTPETMEVSSLLMSSGANQQLVSKNITPDVSNEITDSNATRPTLSKEVSVDSDNANLETGKGINLSGQQRSANQELDIDHSEESDDQDETSNSSAEVEDRDKTGNFDMDVDSQDEINDSGKNFGGQDEPDSLPVDVDNQDKASSSSIDTSNQDETDGFDTEADDNNILLDDLKAAEESLLHTGTETTPETTARPLEIHSEETETTTTTEAEPRSLSSEDKDDDDNGSGSDNDNYENNDEDLVEGTTPPESSESIFKLPTAPQVDPKKQSENSQAHLDSADSLPEVISPKQSTTPTSSSQQPINPITANIPDVPAQPEINGVPDINYTPTPSDAILPPPPAPPIESFDSALPPAQPAIPAVPQPKPAEQNFASREMATPSIPPLPTASQSIAPIEPPTTADDAKKSAGPTSLGPQPAMQDQVYVPQASDPSAFKIPGM